MGGKEQVYLIKLLKCLEVAILSISVSNTGRRLNILSDTYRFERGLDADSPKWVHDYVSSLII